MEPVCLTGVCEESQGRRLTVGESGIKTEKMIEAFYERFGYGGEVRVYFAPGRVNLIGEHTDYNGGHVLPCALTMGTYGVARKRSDRRLRFYSMNFETVGVIESSLDDLKPYRAADWTNYPKGVMWAFGEKGMEMTAGLDLLLWGNIPNGSGLSSSASVEILTGYILRDLYGFKVTNQELALIGQYSENRFNGVNCGIMDQFAIAMGKKDYGIFLDTNTLNYDLVPIKLEGIRIVIACSNKKRGLGDTKYNERRSECEHALADLCRFIQIDSLGDLLEEDFDIYKIGIDDLTQRKRAKHAVYENRRTIKAVEALRANKIEVFGQLMNESHRSLHHDYEVTGIELDTLVETAWQQPGVIGARMTGAGFGGCTVNLVKEEWIDSFIEAVGETYEKKIGYLADFYVADIGGGPCRLV